MVKYCMECKKVSYFAVIVTQEVKDWEPGVDALGEVKLEFCPDCLIKFAQKVKLQEQAKGFDV